MKKTTLAGGTSPFAHLLGGAAALAGRALGRRAEEDEDQPDPDAENEDPDAEDPDAEEEPAEEPEKKGKKGKKAAAEDPEDPEAEEDEIEEPEDEKEAEGFRAGRLAERKRCAAIFASPAAAGRPDLAATLAFSTRQSSAEAIAVLGAANTPGTRPRSLDDRMGNRRDARPGAGGGTTAKPDDFAGKMAAALKKAGR